LDLNIQGSGTGSVIVESVKFTDNNIQSVGTNANLLLTPQGNASVIINNNGSFVFNAKDFLFKHIFICLLIFPMKVSLNGCD
jgi:hypothetical protein